MRLSLPNVVTNADGTYSVRLRAPDGYRLPDGTPSPKRPTERIEAWDPDAPQPRVIPTVAERVDVFLEAYTGRDAYTKKCLGWNLKHAKKPTSDGGLGEVRLDRVTVDDVKQWRAKVPDGSRWHVHKSLRQLFEDAKRAKLITENVAALVENPRPTVRPGRERVQTFTWDELDAVADGPSGEWAAIPHFAAATGLRSEEWIALRRSDLDLKAAVPSVSVERAYSHGELKSTKTKEIRRVPLQDEALRALERHPFRVDVSLVFCEIREQRKPKAEPWIALDHFRKV